MQLAQAIFISSRYKIFCIFRGTFPKWLDFHLEESKPGCSNMQEQGMAVSAIENIFNVFNLFANGMEKGLSLFQSSAKGP